MSGRPVATYDDNSLSAKRGNRAKDDFIRYAGEFFPHIILRDVRSILTDNSTGYTMPWDINFWDKAVGDVTDGRNEFEVGTTLYPGNDRYSFCKTKHEYCTAEWMVLVSYDRDDQLDARDISIVPMDSVRRYVDRAVAQRGWKESIAEQGEDYASIPMRFNVGRSLIEFGNDEWF